MAWGRHAPNTVETGRLTGGDQAVADTERLGIETEADRPAHAWEVDEAESWEPVAPDTWYPPSDEDQAAGADEATWSDAARGEAEWAGAGVASTQPEGEEPVRTPQRRETDERGTQPPLARMALGLASLAAQRMRGGVPAGDGLVTGLGVVRHTANGLMALGERVLGQASRVAANAVQGAATLPVVGAPIRAGLRSQRRLASATTHVRERLARLAAEAREHHPGSADTAPSAGSSTVDNPEPGEHR